MKNIHSYITAALLAAFAWMAWSAFGALSWFRGWEAFCKADALLEKYSALSASFEPSFEPSGGVIFKIPSLAADNTAMRGAFDRVIAECAPGALTATLIPSGASFRKEEKKTFPGFSRCELTCGGALVHFYCSSGSGVFSRTYTFEYGLTPLSEPVTR